MLINARDFNNYGEILGMNGQNSYKNRPNLVVQFAQYYC